MKEVKEIKEVLFKEIPYLKENGDKFLKNEIPRSKFKAISGGFGVYSHRTVGDFMIRLRVSCGVIPIGTLNYIYDLSRKYDLEKIHLTTRESVQLHSLSLEEICEVMADALDHDVFTRGAGGNFPRNVAMSPLSGVDPKEAFDVTPYALAVDKHFISKIYTYKLPRKLKVAFSNTEDDTAHATVQDLGFISVKHAGKNYFKVFLGGGLGRNPRTGVKFPELVLPEDVLYHVEAMTKLFMAEGDYENKGKARVRYILDRLGEETFIKEYKKYLEEVKKDPTLKVKESYINYDKTCTSEALEGFRVFKQKQDGLYSVYFHPFGGELYVNDLEKILDLINGFENVMIRATMDESLYFLNLSSKEAKLLLKATENMGAENNLQRSVACIGVPTCQMGVLESQKYLKAILDYFKEKDFNEDVLPKVAISGCPNSCGFHEANIIGLCGKKKKVNDVITDCFDLQLGGNLFLGESTLGKSYGDIKAEDAPKFLYDLALLLSNKKINFKELLKENSKELQDLIDKYLV